MGTKSKGFGCTWNNYHPTWETGLPVIIETNLTSEVPANGVIPFQGISFGQGRSGIHVDSGTIFLCPGIYDVSYTMTVRTADAGKITATMSYGGGAKISNAYSQTVADAAGLVTGELTDSFLIKVSPCHEGLPSIVLTNTSGVPLILGGDLHLRITRLA